VTDSRRHPIQALEIRVDAIRTTRRRRAPAESDFTAASHPPRVRLRTLADDGLSFVIEVRAQVLVPLLEDEVWAAELGLVATFVSETHLRRVDVQSFTQLSGVFLVWPYARAYLTELARMAGVTAPLLPLFYRPAG